MIKKVLLLSIPFSVGCCIRNHCERPAPTWKTEACITAKFDPCNEQRPVHGVDASFKVVKEW